MDAVQRNTLAFTRLANAINALDVKAQADLATALAALPASVVINDGAAGAGNVWSSNKTQAQINAGIASIIAGAPESQNTLNEVAAQITALIQADQGLLSFGAVQALSVAQKLQACQNIGIGNPDTDYVAIISAALNVGL